MIVDISVVITVAMLTVIFVDCLPSWFGLVSKDQLDDVNDRADRYELLLSQSEKLTQTCLERMARKNRQIYALQEKLNRVEAQSNQEKK